MNTLDLFILLVLAVGLLRGVSTGIIRQVASIAGLILAFVFAVQLMRSVGRLASESLGISDEVAPLVGFLLVFLVIQIAVFALVRLVETLVGALRLSVVNRVLGGVVGAFKAVLAMSVLFLVLSRFSLPGPGARAASALYDPVASALPRAWDYLSDRVPEMDDISQRFGLPVHTD